MLLSAHMKRTCPNCGSETISVLKLMSIRPKCINCKEKIGHHWFLNTIFVCVFIFAQLITALYLIDVGLSFWLGVSIFILVSVSGVFLWALLGPLEVKKSILEP